MSKANKKTDEEIRADLESCIQAMIEPEDASDRMHYRKTVRAMRRAEKRIAELSPHGPVGEQAMRHFYGASGYVAKGGDTTRDDHVAWLRYRDGRIELCDSDSDGAFPVYRAKKQREWLPISTAPAHLPILLWWRHCYTPRVGIYVTDETGEGWKCDGDQCIPRNQKDCLFWQFLPPNPVSDDGSYGHTIDNTYR